MLSRVWVWGTPAWRAGPSSTPHPSGPKGMRAGRKHPDGTRWVKHNVFLVMAPVPLSPATLWKRPNLSPPAGNPVKTICCFVLMNAVKAFGGTGFTCPCKRKTPQLSKMLAGDREFIRDGSDALVLTKPGVASEPLRVSSDI